MVDATGSSAPDARERGINHLARGERRADVAQRVERLEGDALGGEVPREAVAGEDPVGGPGGTAVRVAVADVHEWPNRRQGAALALVMADGAHAFVAEHELLALRRRD